MTSHPAAKGGIGNWARILQKQINNYKEVEPYYIYPADYDENEKPAIERTPLERVFRGSWLMLRAEKQLVQYLHAKKEKVVIHLTTSGSLSVVRDFLYSITARIHKVPLVLHIRFGRIPELVNSKSVEWFILKQALKMSSAIIAIDKRTFDALNEMWPQKTIEYIPNYFDTNSIADINNIKLKNRTILFVGWVIKAKGIEELISAWGSIREKYPNYELVLAGPITEEYRETLNNKFDFDQVRITGELSHDEAMKLMKASEIFVLPSYTEGFPNVILEAMALGKPIVASAVGAIPEMIEGCGCLIQKKNIEEIQKSLVFLLEHENERRKMGELATNRVDKLYSVPVIMDGYINLWFKCCNEM